MTKITPTSDDLKASGCTKEQIEQFSECRNRSEKLKFLERHRKELLNSIHDKEKQISTLDYLAHKIEKSE